ncbi:MAG: FmdB family zinc ribbon protein [Candidatus Eisenbacteria bacterium]|nr:zinc ribbon domain-containing protein [Candidatus Eisenbacteria bacterium]
MPTYDYVCDHCGYAFELFQKMSDPPEQVCPRCDGKLRRLIGTGAGILFKGSGFYITDYRSPEYKAKAKAESVPASTSGASGGAKKPNGSAGSGSGEAKKPGGTGGGGGESKSTKPSSSGPSAGKD